MAPSVSELATALSDANPSPPRNSDTISPVNGTNSAENNNSAGPVNGSATHIVDGKAAGPTVNGLATGDLPADSIANYDVLIVGTGPAGASLACFLSSHGITGLMISSASSTADTPRAHITNIAALETLRDLGLDSECTSQATSGSCMMHTRWCHDMAGEEYARIYAWGNDPHRKGDYEMASPCAPCDLPQTLLEPILVNYATKSGFRTRFDTCFISFEDKGPAGVDTTLLDNISGKQYRVHSRYLLGADGARSRIMKQLELPLIAQAGGGTAINILVKADLTHHIKHRQGNLHWVMQPDQPHCDLGWMAIVRMVKPWHEWMFILFPKPGVPRSNPTKAEYLAQIKNFIGDDSIPAEILDISPWTINDIVAAEYSRESVFCLGDTVHRHPPFNGLGSNTCIQDSFNLAWKIAYVMKGRASPKLLETYSLERQPVGQSISTRANVSFRQHSRIWESLGMFPDSLSKRVAILDELSSPTTKGQLRRQNLQAAIAGTAHEFHGLGIEMNQFYSGPGIYSMDEPDPFRLEGLAAENPVMHYMRSTYPGKRLPHAWLNKKCPVQPISTVDLAGKGGFTLITGIGGASWEQAANTVSKELQVQIQSCAIGFSLEWVDMYSEWEKVRGVKESGAILVRPDRFVAWRSQEVLLDENACENKLLEVMRSVLGLSA
ncbi:1,2,4-dichlorophenol hydroxylase [Hyphodiscus hymeniophilus]|uniref:1,2,4-dichlorophenol hydroxylase n=1 Tax=Hyphodiscus hymeniophilus TaxID=353542 RepID=A0A9P6SQR7_9HELO|nr:1,2,4-dichlorophenol hydroxylase [Hyphodiscus hymeniophilus]